VATLCSWLERGQNDMPSSVLGRGARGRPLWFDQDEITAWIESHPDLVREEDQT
jgi:hypothetical protein